MVILEILTGGWDMSVYLGCKTDTRSDRDSVTRQGFCIFQRTPALNYKNFGFFKVAFELWCVYQKIFLMTDRMESFILYSFSKKLSVVDNNFLSGESSHFNWENLLVQ